MSQPTPKSAAKQFESLSSDLKPRELMERDPELTSVPDAALLAVILKTGTEGIDVYTLAHRLIEAFGSVKAVFSSDWRGIEARIKEWNKACPERPIKGLGHVKCLELAAAFEIGKRWSRMTPEEIRKHKVTDSEKAYSVFNSVLTPGDDKENLYVLLLNNKNAPLCEPLRIARGTSNSVHGYTRDVFKEALKWGANAVMVAHNHPSGDPTPGEADLRFTSRLVELSKVAQIRFLDHLVLGSPDSDGGRGFASIRELHPDIFGI